MKASVDQDGCIACELCVSVCPEVFSMDDESGKAKAIEDDIPEEIEGEAEDARDGCPVSVIDLKD
jgi:ferredoxin